VSDRLSRPDAAQRVVCRDETLALRFGIDADHARDLIRRAAADADVDAAVALVVELRDRLREQQRLMERQRQDGDPDAHAARAFGDRGRQ
jgi:hypothetical protein